MPAEPEVVTNGPLRELAEVRDETGFAWVCRGSRVENGKLTEVHQITSGDRDEYERHMRAHGFKPPKSTYEPWKPRKAPRPARDYSPKPMDAGQRVEWVKVTEGHRENPAYLTDDGTYVPPSGPWIEETRETRTGVIWSVADTASAWWVQPDDDPAHPVYVKRAGKSWRDRAHGEGALYEMPGVAEAARANAIRAETIRTRGTFPVIDSQSADHGGGYRSRGTNHIFLVWHSDPRCPRAAGKDQYDPGDHPQGIVYGYQPEGRAIRSLGQACWTVLDIANTLVSGEQAPSCLCPDCIVNLDTDHLATPAVTGTPQPADAPGTAAEPDADTGASALRAEPGTTRSRTRFAVALAPPATDSEFLDSCARLGEVLESLAGQIGCWADGLGALNLPRSVLTALHQAGDGIIAARIAAAEAARAFEDEFEDARHVAARGLRFTGQGITDPCPCHLSHGPGQPGLSRPSA
jgi:hypothetical protein